MITILTLAVALAQPCLAPPKVAKHHHLHTSGKASVQSCVTPPVPMCFREPAPEPDIEPLAMPLVYYTEGLSTDNSPPPAGDTSQDEPPTVAGGGVIVIGTTGTYGPIGGGTLPGAPGGYSPPTGSPPTRAPEMNGAGAAGALTLLFGCVAVLRGRRAS